VVPRANLLRQKVDQVAKIAVLRSGAGDFSDASRLALRLSGTIFTRWPVCPGKATGRVHFGLWRPGSKTSGYDSIEAVALYLHPWHCRAGFTRR